MAASEWIFNLTNCKGVFPSNKRNTKMKLGDFSILQLFSFRVDMQLYENNEPFRLPQQWLYTWLLM